MKKRINILSHIVCYLGLNANPRHLIRARIQRLCLSASRFSLCFCFSVFMFSCLRAQDSDNNYRTPLSQVLSRIESTFNIDLKYSENQVANKWLDYGLWKIQSYDLEKTLARVLYPFDLDYVKEDSGIYKIKSYEYARRSVEEGEQFLEYLTKLYDDSTSWESRRKELQECMWQALGLSQLPEKPNTRPIITNPRVKNGYTIENIAIETLPGVFVTGSLYKPTEPSRKMPVVLNPNGHFEDGRYRADMQVRCAMLARMGAMAFSYDLFGWGESRLQFAPENHRKSVAQTIQVLNNIRILDYLLSLPNADSERVAITGGSGGGSQSMIISALDDRIKLSVPVVMASSHFSGGCPCESGKPVHLCGNGTNNAEVAAMAAPKPQLIISNGKDWTHTVPQLEFPFIRRIYGFFGKEDNVANVHLPEEGHDYGPSKRQAMYNFISYHFGLDIDKEKDASGKVDESKCVIEPPEALYVFGKDGKGLPERAVKDIDALYKLLGQK